MVWFVFFWLKKLCNLVGTWRILQRVGSHRWTTDDIVTAYIAKNEILKDEAFRKNSTNSNNIDCDCDTRTANKKKNPLFYLDLGCGNGSVLSMVSWGLMDDFDLTAFGIEARSEAVKLAKRSLAYNIGSENIGKKISIINADFRAIESCSVSATNTNGDGCRNHDSNNATKAIHHDGMEEFQKIAKRKFDLITGTPPYFRVDFSTEEESSKQTLPQKVVKAAVINQG